MFRLAKIPETGEPAYFLLCDHKACMDARRAAANVTNQEEFRLTRRRFIQTAISEGWWIDLEGVYCPVHAREMMHAAKEAEERRSQIVPAHGSQIASFGKSL